MFYVDGSNSGDVRLWGSQNELLVIIYQEKVIKLQSVTDLEFTKSHQPGVYEESGWISPHDIHLFEVRSTVSRLFCIAHTRIS